MTTAIPDIADLVKILREQPEWAETLRAVLLTQELLELPEKVAQLTARLEEFIAEQRETNRLFVEQMARQNARIDEFIAEQKEINRLFAAQLARQEADSTELKSDMAVVKADVAELKATTSRLEADTAELKSDVAELKATASRQEGDIAELKSDVAELKATTSRLEADSAELKADVAELKATTARQEGDIAELKSDMVVVKADVAELKSDMVVVKATLIQMDGRIGRLEGTVGRLEGADLERQIHANIAATLGARREFRHPRVLKSIVVSPVPELFDLLYAAQDDGRIDQAQVNSLMQTDIILSVRDSHARLNYVAIEISRTVHDYDLTRARERADILAAASTAPVVALVIGYIIPPPQRRKADELGVQLLESASLAAFRADGD